MAEIFPLDRALPMVDEKGFMTLRVEEWNELVSALADLEGEGSPEGVIEAAAGRWYRDTVASSGSIMYKKQLDSIFNDRTQGWELIG